MKLENYKKSVGSDPCVRPVSNDNFITLTAFLEVRHV
jgi:hypothetical protein